MAKLTEQEFRKELTTGKLNNLYLIYGDEKYLVKKYTEQLCGKAAGKKPSDFDFIRLGSTAPLEEIFAASEQLPVFSKHKCVLVSDFNAETLSENDIKLLEEFLSDISHDTILIFSMPTASNTDTKKGSDKKGGKFRKLLSVVEKHGAVIELPKRGDIALEKVIVSWAEQGGCKLDKINASKIISLCGTDMTTLRNELDKLIAYADNSEITDQMIKLLVVKNTETRIYALSDCIIRNDINGAYKQLFGLFEQNERSEMILSVLSSAFIDMYRMRVALESGKTASVVAVDFKYGRREFILKNAQNNSSKYSIQTLREILDIILRTDLKLKSSAADNRIILETLISRLLIVTGKKS